MFKVRLLFGLMHDYGPHREAAGLATRRRNP
jgi:hypothetical protein